MKEVADTAQRCLKFSSVVRGLGCEDVGSGLRLLIGTGLGWESKEPNSVVRTEASGWPNILKPYHEAAGIISVSVYGP